MAKLSQIKLGNTTYDIGAAWDNISGKPSSFPPSSHNHDFITYKDTRADNQSPNDVQAGLTVHLKANGTDGISDGGSYHAVLNVKGWGDYSGGPYWQSAVTANNNMYFRRSTAGTAWGTWQKVLSDNNYTDYTVTKTGSGASGTWGINISGNAATATKATQDGSGNVITSKYVTLDTAQTISGTKTMTGSLKVSGRYAGGGDDEGIIVGFANNGYAGLCLGGPSEARSVFYFKSDGSSPFWRYNNGSASYDILHPSKSGTIALTSDLEGYAKLASPNNLIHSGNEFTFASDAYNGDLFINYRTANNAQNGNITAYRFCKGAGGTLSNIAADTFIGKLSGNADSATVSTRSKYLETWYNEKDKTYGASYPLYAWWETGSECRLMIDNYTVKVNYADSAGTCTSLSTNAGSATKAIYFSGGRPVQCNDTINHNISGTAANSNILNINNSANLSGCLQYIQVSAQTSGNDLPTNTWWHVIKMNHGQGDTYYKRLLAFDFWNDNIMTSGAAGDGKTRTWKQVWVEGNSVTGAVWNDYAECRESNCEEPGRVLIENGDDTLSLATERLQQFAGISSDTWGFSQGETEKAKTHIAVAGRVLAYPYQNRDNYKPGDCVCTAPGGTVDIMTEEEIIRYPHRIVGIVSCVPDYEEWGGGEKADRGPVKVNGRIWIKVK